VKKGKKGKKACFWDAQPVRKAEKIQFQFSKEKNVENNFYDYGLLLGLFFGRDFWTKLSQHFA
jgi:hypothetical protein